MEKSVSCKRPDSLKGVHVFEPTQHLILNPKDGGNCAWNVGIHL